MAMYPEDNIDKDKVVKKKKYFELDCYECGKYCGLYFRENPTFFIELFFCSIKCHEDHLEKKGKKSVN